MKSDKSALTAVAIVTVFLFSFISIGAYQEYTANKQSTPSDGPQVILPAGYETNFSLTGSGWGIGYLYPFNVSVPSLLTGNWTSNTLMKVFLTTEAQYLAKNFSFENDLSWVSSGSFNITLQPGEYHLNFNSDGNLTVQNGKFTITSDVKLTPK
ncbi:MAG: hypothetical protein M1476_03090 [Candidatus Thermoplasmatota archaeon]|nr:hypothetical protein [Candidatus Thermoplasmatota archaeon]